MHTTSAKRSNESRKKQIGGVAERSLAYANSGRIVHRRQEARIECTLDAYKFRHVITDEQHQAACMFRWCYLTAARTVKVTDPDYSRIDGAVLATREDKPTLARAPRWSVARRSRPYTRPHHIV
jgi:hypothetical protein